MANTVTPDSKPSQKLYQWLDARLPLTAMRELAEKKKVPVHQHSIWYYLGGIAMMFIGIQVITGILLMIYYIPELSSAHASILNINSQVDFGWFIRSLHSWGANLMILVLFAHLFSTYFMKAYRSPRELTWLTGLGLLVIGFAFGFTGYLLPWDEVAFFATKIGLDIAAKTPVVGELMATILRGGHDIGQATLSRFFVIHVFVLPIALMGLLGLHLMLIQFQGMSEPASFSDQPKEKKQYIPFFPTFALKDAMVWLLVFNVLAAFATLSPWGLGSEADPFAPAPVGIKPEWYFLAMFQFLKLLPAYIGPFEGEMVGMGFFAAIGLVFVLAPFIDRSRAGQWSAVFRWYGVLVLLGLIVFTVWGLQ